MLPALELKAANFIWGQLRQVNLRVGVGERWVLVGPSGHGKSTLLRALAGLKAPDAGQFFLHGEDFYQLPSPQQSARQRKMGMLFQKNALFDSLSVFENVAFPLRELTGLSESEVKERVCGFLAAVELDHVGELYPEELSGGMQKRLGIARALALDPEVIFYDDPTAGLDPLTSRKIVALICRLQQERRATMVAITNDMNRAFEMADFLALVVQGELIVTGSPSQTRAHGDARVRQFIRGQLQGPLSDDSF